MPATAFKVGLATRILQMGILRSRGVGTAQV